MLLPSSSTPNRSRTEEWQIRSGVTNSSQFFAGFNMTEPKKLLFFTVPRAESTAYPCSMRFCISYLQAKHSIQVSYISLGIAVTFVALNAERELKSFSRYLAKYMALD